MIRTANLSAVQLRFLGQTRLRIGPSVSIVLDCTKGTCGGVPLPHPFRCRLPPAPTGGTMDQSLYPVSCRAAVLSDFGEATERERSRCGTMHSGALHFGSCSFRWVRSSAI